MHRVAMKRLEQQHALRWHEAQQAHAQQISALVDENRRLRRKLEEGVNSSSLAKAFATKETELRAEIRELTCKVYSSVCDCLGGPNLSGAD